MRMHFYFTKLHFTVLHCTALHCNLLYCIALYYNSLTSVVSQCSAVPALPEAVLRYITLIFFPGLLPVSAALYLPSLRPSKILGEFGGLESGIILY